MVILQAEIRCYIVPGLKTWFEDFPSVQTNIHWEEGGEEGKVAGFSKLIFNVIFRWVFYVSNSMSTR